MRKTLHTAIFAVAVMSLFALPHSGNAIPIIADTASSAEGIGDFSGTLTFTPSTSSTGILTVSLTHTTSGFAEAYITGFVFLLPEGITATSVTSSTHPSFELLTEKKALSAPPFGEFDTGAALGGDWTGGGKPQDGIGIGTGIPDTGIFDFELTRTGLGAGTIDDFLSEVTEREWFVARIRGFEPCGGSDKVPADIASVPEPATLVLLGSGLALMGLLGRRKSRKSTS